MAIPGSYYITAYEKKERPSGSPSVAEIKTPGILRSERRKSRVDAADPTRYTIFFIKQSTIMTKIIVPSDHARDKCHCYSDNHCTTSRTTTITVDGKKTTGRLPQL